MTPLGLAPGQQWTVAPGPRWQARLGRDGRAHVIGEGLAWHPEYREGYTDCGKPPRDGRIWFDYPDGALVPAMCRQLARPWHDFRRACRAAAMHERMVLAAKRREGAAHP